MSLHISRTNNRQNVPAGAGQQLYELVHELHVPFVVALIPTDEPCECGEPGHANKPAMMVRVDESTVTPDVAIALLLKAIESIQVANNVSKRGN